MLNILKITVLFAVMIFVLMLFGTAAGWAGTGHWWGGVAGAVVALIGGLITNLISLFASDRVVIASTGAKPVPAGEIPWLHQDLTELALRDGIPTPRL